MLTDPKDKNKGKKKSGFNSKAFKYAVGMIESSGGKNLTNPNSSASGKYHFLWKYLKQEPLLKGMSQREFINNPELQEKVMDDAIAGKLQGFPNYNTYSQGLKAKYNSDLPIESIAALTHFLGSGGVKTYLANKSYNVPGKVNLSAEGYTNKFSKYMNDYTKQNAPVNNVPDAEYSGIEGNTEGFIKQKAQQALIQQQDNTRVAPKDFNPPTGLQTPQNMDSSNESTESFNPPDGLVTPNNFKYGGNSYKKKYHNGGELDRFENGGTHEQNPLGGIPQGVGKNGKVNLVEEGETKWNDYVFSDSISLDGTFTSPDGKSTNVFKNGGKINSKGPGDSMDPESSESTTALPALPAQQEDNSFDVTKYAHLSKGKYVNKENMHIPDLREGYKEDIFAYKNPEQINFRDAVKDAPSEAFLQRYNDPTTRKRLMEQGNVTSEQIDNMILKGLTTNKEVGGNPRGSNASYSNDTIHMGENHKDNANIENHERVHASGIDAVMGDKLTSILGNAFDQKKDALKRQDAKTLDYLNRPHEAYGNFAQFRSSLELKPGEQIDGARLKKLVKEKKLGMENFYRAYDDDKIIEALNTVAKQDTDKNNFDNYRLS